MSTAGGYATRRYERGLRSWRHRAIRPLVAVCSPIVLALVAVAALTGAAPLWFGAGLALGGSLGMIMLARDDPPPDVANWGLGASGERRTGEALAALEAEGWQVEHDRELSRGGNLDHLVVGPNGIFVVETKSIRGRAAIEDGMLAVHARDDDETVWRHRGLRGRLIAISATLANEISRSTRIRPWVHPVVVIWGEFPAGVVEDDGVAYVRGDELVAWLRSRPPIPHEFELAS
jgi:hypothetical protein